MPSWEEILKNAIKHPEVVGKLQEILSGTKITSQSENRIVFESDTHKMIVSRMKGSQPTDNWLLTAYEKKEKPVSASSSDIETEPEGKRNGTATPQNGAISAGKGSGKTANEQGKGEKVAEGEESVATGAEDTGGQGEQGNAQSGEQDAPVEEPVKAGAGTESNAGEEVKPSNNNLFQYFTGSLSEMIARAKQSATDFAKKIIAPVSSRLKQDLEAQGVALDGEFNHVIDNSAIRHTLKQHGGKNEEKRGQIPVTEADFERIPEVVNDYDEVKVEKGKRDALNLIYSKTYEDGTTVFVEEKRDKRQELAAVTMWKQKSPTLTDANRENTTPISDLSVTSEDKDTQKPATPTRKSRESC